MSLHLLVVEDDDAIAAPLCEGLEREGFRVARARSGAEALAAETPDLVLLDLGLPDLDGVEVCRRLRARGAVPIIVVTARGEEEDRVRGLELGADDYVVKPFGFRELLARVRAVTRRAEGPRRDGPGEGGVPAVQAVGPAGEVVVDRRARRVLVAGDEVALTPTEFELLSLFSRDPGALCDRQTILEEVWGPHWYGTTKMIDVHVASLRKKLGVPGLVETVRGVGFRLGGAPDPT